MARYDTVATIVDQVGQELGLWDVAVADPYASTDGNVVRMRAILTSVGRLLVRKHRWFHLKRESTLTGDGSATVFELPLDFDGFVDETGNNRTNGQPIDVPLSPQRWQRIKARSLGATIQLQARLRFGPVPRVEFMTAPADDTVIAFEYYSRNWVRVMQDGIAGTIVLATPLAADTLVIGGVNAVFGTDWSDGSTLWDFLLSEDVALFTDQTLLKTSSTQLTMIGTEGYTWLSSAPERIVMSPRGGRMGYSDGFPEFDAPAAAADTIWLDSNLVSRALKVAFLKNVGLDATAAVEEYREALEQVSCPEGAPTLNLDGSPAGERLIDGLDITSRRVGA